MVVPVEAHETEADVLGPDTAVHPLQFLFPPQRAPVDLAALEQPKPARLSALADQLWTPPDPDDAAPPAGVRSGPRRHAGRGARLTGGRTYAGADQGGVAVPGALQVA
jgi:hypothetical protein